jgi:hypothetical protein
MPARKCTLATAVGELKQVLHEDRANDWIGRMEKALAGVEDAVRRHRAGLKDEEGRVVDVDTSLNPSPGVARRADALRQELDQLMQEAGRLRQKVKSLHPATGAVDAATAAGALPVAPETADVADFGVFCERVEHLLEGFEHFDEEEGRLMQESATMDLGAGD